MSSSYAVFQLTGIWFLLCNIQCNACTFHSLFVGLMINCLVVSLTELEKGISWKLLFKAQNRFTIYEYLQIWVDAHSWVVKNILKLMKCVHFYLFSLFVWFAISVFVCLIIKIIKAQQKLQLGEVEPLNLISLPYV